MTMAVSSFASRFRTKIESARVGPGKRLSPECGRFADLVPEHDDAIDFKDAKRYNAEYEFASMPTSDSLPSLQTSLSNGSLATWLSEMDAQPAMKTEEAETSSKCELDFEDTDSDTEDIEDRRTQIEDRMDWLGSNGKFCLSTQLVPTMLELPSLEEFMGDDSGSESGDDSEGVMSTQRFPTMLELPSPAKFMLEDSDSESDDDSEDDMWDNNMGLSGSTSAEFGSGAASSEGI